MIILKPYQEIAVEDLIGETNKLLDFSENKVCIFKSPTGSGKTLMMAEMLKRLVTERIDEKEISFIWISVRQLHYQSKDKLEKYFEDSRVIKCSNFDDLEDKKIGKNEILFFNWESINKKKNIYVRENETDNNLSNIITNTKEEGREIILIIDESHHTAKSEKSKEIIEEISPKVTIEVSATPYLNGHLVEVDFNKVILDGMIKKESDKKIEDEMEFIPMNIVKDKKQLSIRIPSKIIEALDITPENDSFLFILDKKKLSLRGLLINKGDIDKIKNG